MLTDDDQLIGVCERDVDIMSDFGYRILAIGEAFITYAFPFLLTIVMDIAVLYQSANLRGYNSRPSKLSSYLKDGQKREDSRVIIQYEEMVKPKR
ncbi:hypothetical protein GCK72_015375 [Caenorhabditis remanei]|uniref:Uncharacterized protein n=1 Tax=Caenorhabditis remanei TaxID=31234 RepID=A0A6A5GWP0_CAERE|nr:hypothetical protein GCK72_015375 [Caenorhabditis remanei]KAF1758915.1 hypothetical protein GCK72_015375 [Caenorhabditis remanei]